MKSNRRPVPSIWLPLLMLLGFAAVMGLAAGLVGGAVTAFLSVPLVIIVCVFVNYRVGLVSLAFLLPWAASPLLPQARGINIVNYLLLATVVSFALRFFRHRQSFQGWPKEFTWFYLLPVTAGVMWSIPHLGIAAQSFAGHATALTFGTTEFLKAYFVAPMGFVVFAALLSSAVRESPKPERYVVLFMIAGTVPALVVFLLIQLYDVPLSALQAQRSFMAPIGMHANEMAALLAFAVGPMIFVMGQWKNFASRTAALGAVVIVVLALLLTFSRGGAIALLIILALYVVQRRQFFLIGIGVVGLVGALLFAPPAFKERWLTGVQEDAVQNSVNNLSDPLTAGRVAVWERLLPEVQKSPLVGRGIGSTAWSDLVKTGIYMAIHPHNMYLALLMDLGLIGFAALSYWYAQMIIRLRALPKASELSPVLQQFFAGSLASLLGVLVMNVTNGYYTPKPEYTFQWFGIGILFAFWSLAPARSKVSRAKAQRVPRPWQPGR